MAELLQLLRDSSVERFEISAGRARARYGHSIDGVSPGVLTDPPPLLFHTTRAAFFTTIRSEGISSRGRRYAHLTSSWEYAESLRDQHVLDGSPSLILGVDAQAARKVAIPFYRASDAVWTTPYVPPRFLSLLLPEAHAPEGFRKLSLAESDNREGFQFEAMLEFLKDDDLPH
jgi:putative RNA 2'-phosphotransferase